MVPTVVLSENRIWIEIEDHEDIEVTGIADITVTLLDVRQSHPVNGSWIIAPSVDVPFNDVVKAIDAARAAQFPNVMVAGRAA